MLSLQLFGVLFMLIMQYINYINLKKNNLSVSEFLFWAVVWLVSLIAIVFPSSLDDIRRSLYINSVLDLIFIVSILFMGVILYYNSVIVTKNNKQLNELVRKIALSKDKK